mmetsp:Transcript_96002/g.256508  ORF Transcript_96002/g.256508 Transcript_96002/m.256508 type:complete len:93 (+) Transcript_96002:89-367(+)
MRCSAGVAGVALFFFLAFALLLCEFGAWAGLPLWPLCLIQSALRSAVVGGGVAERRIWGLEGRSSTGDLTSVFRGIGIGSLKLPLELQGKRP